MVDHSAQTEAPPLNLGPAGLRPFPEVAMSGPAPWMIRERNAMLLNVAGWLLAALTASMFIVSHAQHVRPMPTPPKRS